MKCPPSPQFLDRAPPMLVTDAMVVYCCPRRRRQCRRVADDTPDRQDNDVSRSGS